MHVSLPDIDMVGLCGAEETWHATVQTFSKSVATSREPFETGPYTVPIGSRHTFVSMCTQRYGYRIVSPESDTPKRCSQGVPKVAETPCPGQCGQASRPGEAGQGFEVL